MVTIYKNIFSKEPHYVEVDKCLQRIKNGNSKDLVLKIRTALDKEKSNDLKKNLPSVCFSGKFGNDRKDEQLLEHSKLIVLDFDNLESCDEFKHALFLNEFIYATWISPSGKGVKALVKIADGSKHREHFQALQDVFNDIDRSGINVSRVCYESYDENILINENSTIFSKIKKIERVVETIKNYDNGAVFDNILKWITNSGNAFISGERNSFIFKLASACCRFGIHESDCFSYCNSTVLRNDNSFTNKEAELCISSAYRSNKNSFGSACFENDKLVDKVTKLEVEVEKIIDLNEKVKDVIYGQSVKQEALNLYDFGYTSARTTGIVTLDEYFKWKKGEATLLSGIGNYGKSTFSKYLFLLQMIQFNSKIAIFTPEECPAHEFYHDLTETYLGASCIPSNQHRPSKSEYERVYDLISNHFFFVYPKTIEPTPQYVKECFLELIIKENVEFCVVDPFNQLTNDYASYGGRSDKYLEAILTDFSRFAQENNIHFIIVAHPVKMKLENGNYPCPNVYDMADGAMWNNKMDNILIYHLPYRQTDPKDTTCEIHTKKVRRRKIVGNVGMLDFKYIPFTRRFEFLDIDYMEYAINPIPKQKQNNNYYEKEIVPNINFDFQIDTNPLPF